MPAAPGAPDREALEAAVAAVAGARRPVVLAGRGAVTSGARDALVRLADLLAAPLATTVLAKDLSRGHPGDLGIFGNLSHGVAAAAIGEADCVVAFGASLNSYTSAHGSITRGKRIVQVDEDPAAFGSYTPVDHPVAGDARRAAEAMAALLEEAGHRPAAGWLTGVRRSLREHDPRRDYQDRTAGDTVDVRTAMIRLDQLLPAERQLVSDIGRYVVGVWPHVAVAGGGSFLSMGAFGSIGLGLAGAIGASLARPSVLTVAALGDGGFVMSMAEFTTAVRERLPLLVVVLDDGAYGADHYKLVHFGAHPGYSLNAWPDLVTMARAMGGDGCTVRTLADLEALAGIVPALDGPFLVDVRLDPEVNILAG